MDLSTNIMALNGIGEKKARLLENLNIQTINDLLEYFPRVYQDRTNIKTIRDAENGKDALISGTIIMSTFTGRPHTKKQTLRLLISDGTAEAEVIFFNGKYLQKIFKNGESFTFFGPVTKLNGKTQIVHPEFFRCDPSEASGIMPIYPLTKGITQNEMRKWQGLAQKHISAVEEYLPKEIIEKYNLCPIQYAFKNIHFPKDKVACKEARYRLVFDEFLLFQLGILSLKETTSNSNGIEFSKKENAKEFIDSMPYELTGAQKRVVAEIFEDMDSKKVMNRLVQGDVGSGKTAVAQIALYKAIKSGYQGVMMAPTEILAKQHFQGISEAFDRFGIKCAFLSGNITTKERKEILRSLSNGDIDVLIGTHAIISQDVEFKKLGLVITDEQHRFGVNQRRLLSEKGNMPDQIVMTATPIPRTLAVIFYGDLDISIIDELPKGRKPIKTYAITEAKRIAAYEFMRKEVSQGRQCYVVAPLIEDSESEKLSETKSAEGIFKELCLGFPEFKIALLHGEMKQKEKDEIMEAFSKGEIDVLVATVVIEVGINVPNATIMIIENAERFGLSQLHQLRGRVGRGDKESYCIIINEGNSKIAKERAEIMTSTNDGFVIAEQDLKLRGPGEFFGTKQHGSLEFKIGDIAIHTKVLIKAKEIATEILTAEGGLQDQKYDMLRKRLDSLFNQSENIQI